MKLIDANLIEKLKVEAGLSPRLRSHHLLHNNHDEKVQRLLIGMVKGSFVAPHYHELDEQWEMFAVLQGTLKVKVYDSCGAVTSQIHVGSNTLLPQLIEFSPNEIHSVECVSDFALLLEVKQGPFKPEYAKVSPSWAI